MAATKRTWTGGTSNNANDPTQWSPNGAPQSGDTLTITTGTINVNGNDLAGDPLILTPPTTPQPFQVTVNLDGTAGINFGTDNVFTLDGHAATTFTGGNVVGFSSTITTNPTVTFSGKATFAYGLIVNGSFVNNGAIGITHATFNGDLSGNGSYTLTQYHDGPGAVETKGSVDSALTFTLQGDTALTIDQPGSFKAAIKQGKTTAPDSVVLKGLSATSYQYQNGVLSLFNGDNVIDTVNVDTAPQSVNETNGNVTANFIKAGTGTALPVHPPTLPSPSHFSIADQTTHQVTNVSGDAYSGPVQGIDWQWIVPTNMISDNLNITPSVANVFIRSGDGGDAIDVSAVGGTNILDGGTASNFLTGGGGDDTFFVDDRGPSNDIWTTVRQLHAGDQVTIWGLTRNDFNLMTEANDVLPNAPGLDFGLIKQGQPIINFTLTGYHTDDLQNGRLSVNFGHTNDVQTGSGLLPGSDYMQIVVNS